MMSAINHYMDGDGFATKLVVDDEGKVRNEYVEDDGSISVGDYDMVPLIDRFVEKHPDFSYRGAKGIVALTGYNGILGYRTDQSYETRPDDLDQNKVDWLDSHPDFALRKNGRCQKGRRHHEGRRLVVCKSYMGPSEYRTDLTGYFAGRYAEI